ncbi:MAG: hypothetical protein KDD47_15520 [Acidobacteria bacterium]|nr:hypothetical protein [Acidobacteriota bacterium]
MTTKNGKILRIGILSEVHNLDPKKAHDVDSMFVLRQILETPFVETAEGGGAVPLLFDGPLEKSSADGSEVRARLRQGVTFSDGKPLTADDLAEALSSTHVVQDQAELRLDGETLVFRMKRPNARFDITLSHIECSVYRFAGGGRICGTGPFQLAPESTPQRLRLVRNPHFRHPSALDEVQFRYFPVDADGRASQLRHALEQGEIDLCTVLPRDEISKLSGVRKSFRPGLSTASLFLNTERLRDRRVRQAIGMAIHRLEVAESCYENALAFRARSLLPLGMDMTADGLEHDLQGARRLLEEPGVELPSELSLLLIWGPRPYLPHPRAVAEVICGQLAKLGTTVRVVESASSSEFFRTTIEGRHDLVLSGWAADTSDPADFLEAHLESDRVPSFGNIAVSANHCRWADPATDELLRSLRADPRAETLAELFGILRREVPLVPLIYGSTATVTSFRVLQFVPSQLSVFPVAGLDLRI